MISGEIKLASNKIEDLDADWLQPILDNGNQVDLTCKKKITKIQIIWSFFRESSDLWLRYGLDLHRFQLFRCDFVEWNTNLC